MVRWPILNLWVGTVRKKIRFNFCYIYFSSSVFLFTTIFSEKKKIKRKYLITLILWFLLKWEPPYISIAWRTHKKYFLFPIDDFSFSLLHSRRIDFITSYNFRFSNKNTYTQSYVIYFHKINSIFVTGSEQWGTRQSPCL